MNQTRRIMVLTLLCVAAALAAVTRLPAGKLPANHWELLAVVYPPGREVIVTFGGGEKTLTARGTGKVKWEKDVAALVMEIGDLASTAEAGWAGRQYVLWAIDQQKSSVNMGPVPLRGKGAKWAVQVPLRAFGLLITAEQNPQATAPSAAVAMESLIPADPNLVVPIYKVDLTLAAPGN